MFPGATSVGQSSNVVSVVLIASTSGAIASTQAVTQGTVVTDFAILPGGTCTTGLYLLAGQKCTVNVAFQPTAPGLRTGSVELLGSGGSLLGSSLLAGYATGPLAELLFGMINTVAGDGNWIYQGDGMAATTASLFLPMGVVADSAGNLFISDSNNNRIRRVDAKSGLISTVAGNGVPGFSGDSGPATQATINLPAGITIDGAGNVFFADSGNDVIRRIDALSGLITTVAGLGGRAGFAGDGHAAVAATLASPESVIFDASGNMFIADTGNNAIREVDATNATIRTVAGTGTAGYNGDGILATTAQLNQPWGLAMSPAGLLFFADMDNNRVRSIAADGLISTYAGNGIRGYTETDQGAPNAELNAPAAIAFDPSGVMYIADSGNNRIRYVDVTSSIGTAYGNGAEQLAGDGEQAPFSQFYGPYAIFDDSQGNLFIADMFHNRIREITGESLELQFDPLKVGSVSSAQTYALDNHGNADLIITAMSFTNAVIVPEPPNPNCTVGAVMTPAHNCLVAIEFAPTVVGNPASGAITISSNASNGPSVYILSGDVLSVEPTSIVISSTENPSILADTVTFIGTVTSASNSLTGTVTFLNGSNILCNSNLSSSGTASCITGGLALGQHSITAVYSGDPSDAAATSSVLIQIVKQAPALALSATPNPATVTGSVNISLIGVTGSGYPTGPVTFYDGTTTIGTTTFGGVGSASISTSMLTVGSHNLTAQYGGDATTAPGTSNTVAELITQAATVTTLAVSSGNPTVGTRILLSATVISVGGPSPTGTVTFTDGGAVLGNAQVDNSGNAAMSVASLAPGAHLIVAAYGGDSNDAASSSAAIHETIQQITTTTSLTADKNPANAGAAVHLNATVSSASIYGVLDGQITFSDGLVTLGTTSVDSSGHATLVDATLSVGQHPIVANYSGDTNYAASSSASLSLKVQLTATTVTVAPSASTTQSGMPVSFSISVTSQTAVPTGQVTVTEGSVLIGQAVLSSTGIAVLTTTTLSVGTHLLTASYGGDANYATANSSSWQQVVVLGTSTLTLTGPASPVNAGLTFNVTASLVTNGVSPTGQLTLWDGSRLLGQQALSSSAVTTFNVYGLAVGTHSLTASYGGDSNNAPAVSPAVNVTIQQGQSTTVVTTSLNPQIFRQPVTFTATISSVSPSLGGSVTFFDGASTIGTVPVGYNASAALTTASLALGQHVITAVYSGDTNHVGSTSAALQQQILQAVTASLLSSTNPSIAGNSVKFTVTIAGSSQTSPTGLIQFADSGIALGSVPLDTTGSAALTTSVLPVGLHTISASYAGDANYSAAAATVLQTVQSATTQISETVSANPAIYGTPVTVSATISSNGGGATGAVLFSDGSAPLGIAPLDPAGAASISSSTLAPGIHSMIASYTGDGKTNPSVSSPVLLVVKELTSVSLQSSTNPAQTLTPITLIATVSNSGIGSPTGSVIFTDGSATLGNAVLNASGEATLSLPALAAGSHSLAAAYVGDSTNFGSTSAVVSQVVQLRPTSTTLTATPNTPSNPLEVTLIAVVHSVGVPSATGIVTFTTGGATIGTGVLDATGVATLDVVLSATGESIVATYAGDASYSTSSSPPTSITGGTATQFMLVVDPSSVTVQSNQHTAVAVLLKSLAGFSDTVDLGCVGLPYAATCTFDKTQSVLAANSTVSMHLVIDTGNPLGGGSSADLRSRPSQTMLCLLPFGALICLCFRRKRTIVALGLSTVLTLGSLSLSGCAGLQVNGTPAGVYNFKVVAAGQGTGVTETQNMTLTVTQ